MAPIPSPEGRQKHSLMSDRYRVTPVTRPIDGTVRPPGSKSVTNRALAVAALAAGRSRLTGLLDSRDTQVMIESLGRLGIDVRHDPAAVTAQIAGCSGRPPATSADLWLENSGTSIRFLTALCTLGRGRFRLDGNESRLRDDSVARQRASIEPAKSDNDFHEWEPPLESVSEWIR